MTADSRPRLRTIHKSSKLDNVCYDIRGPVMARARQMEEEGHRIIKLNIGNPAPFGFEAPEEIVQDVIVNLPNASGYSDSKGLFAARKAVMHETQRKGIAGVTIDDIIIGNGVSELIVMSMQALLNNGDEVLVPAPDYPLWTAAVSLGGGKPRHYLCDEGAGWLPDLDDMRAKITPNTRAIVVINPNNPTGALYPTELLKEIIEIARQHQLIIYADEIYDKVLFDGAQHTSIASLADDVLIVTFNGLSKNYRACGYRAGWLIVSGDKRHAKDYLEGRIAGVNKPTHEISEAEWDAVMAVNVKGVFFCTKHAVPYLKKGGGGSIINLSSIYGLVGAPDSPPYHASKGAVRLMTKTDALLYAADRIRVNSIHPGFIATPMVEGYLHQLPEEEKARKALEAMHPLGHLGEPDDIAWGAVYLASDEAKFVTGSELVIDGGYTCR